MAGKKRKTATNAQGADGITLPANALVVNAKAGDRLLITVTVHDGHLVPYHVSWDSDTLIDSLVDGSATTDPMTPGTHQLTWGFIHGLEATWRHKVTATPSSGPEQTLADKSSDKGDRPNSANVAFVVVT